MEPPLHLSCLFLGLRSSEVHLFLSFAQWSPPCTSVAYSSGCARVESRLQQRRERRRDVRLEAEAEHLRLRRHHLLQLRVAQRESLSHGRFAAATASPPWPRTGSRPKFPNCGFTRRKPNNRC